MDQKTDKKEEKEIIEILEKTGAYLKDGHFKLISEKHSDSYIHVRLALAYPEYASLISKMIAEKFKADKDKIDVVVGFSMGGIILAKQVADHLEARPVLGQYKDNEIEFAKGYDIKKDERVLIVDDVLTTGELIFKTIDKIKEERKGVLKGVGIIVDRSKNNIDFGVKTEILARIKTNIWNKDECPKCQAKIPLTDLSSPDTKPIAIIESLPEDIRPVLAIAYSDIFDEIKSGKSLAEVLKVYKPRHELIGEKPERVAVLGSFDRIGTMLEIGKYVSSLGFHAITSRVMFEKDTGKSREIKPYPYETMNDFLKRMIYGCQYIIINYTVEGGQYIETEWCAQAHKPTLGLAEFRSYPYNALKSCEYLKHNKAHGTLFCNGFKAYKEGKKTSGAWICRKHDNCPFPKMDLSKMLLDIYTTSGKMFLIGSDNVNNFKSPIKSFLKCKGVYSCFI